MITMHPPVFSNLALALSLGSQRPTEAVGEALRGLLRDIGAVWSYQLTAIDGRALTVGKVVIAFPQRDVHLDSDHPLRVHVVGRHED